MSNRQTSSAAIQAIAEIEKGIAPYRSMVVALKTIQNMPFTEAIDRANSTTLSAMLRRLRDHFGFVGPNLKRFRLEIAEMEGMSRPDNPVTTEGSKPGN
jgi:hypothetical protein